MIRGGNSGFTCTQGVLPPRVLPIWSYIPMSLVSIQKRPSFQFRSSGVYVTTERFFSCCGVLEQPSHNRRGGQRDTCCSQPTAL